MEQKGESRTPSPHKTTPSAHKHSSSPKLDFSQQSKSSPFQKNENDESYSQQVYSGYGGDRRPTIQMNDLTHIKQHEYKQRKKYKR